MGSQASVRAGVFCGAVLLLAAVRAELGRCSLGSPEDGSLPITHLNGDAERIAERRWEVRPRGYPVPPDRGFVHGLAHAVGQSATGRSIAKKAAPENPGMADSETEAGRSRSGGLRTNGGYSAKRRLAQGCGNTVYGFFVPVAIG